MHELSIALSLLEFVEEESERRGGAEITAIHVKIGELSGVVPDALASAFAMARDHSRLLRCELVIERVPIAILCASCQSERDVASPQSICCAQCGTPAADVLRGRELQVNALELAS